MMQRFVLYQQKNNTMTSLLPFLVVKINLLNMASPVVAFVYTIKKVAFVTMWFVSCVGSRGYPTDTTWTIIILR